MAEAARLAAKMPALQEAAEAMTVPNAFGALLQRQGAVGLNATTSHVRLLLCPISLLALPCPISLISDTSKARFHMIGHGWSSYHLC